jgi:hypothetical protein
LVTCLDFITPIVGSQSQADAIYIDLSSTLDLIPATDLPLFPSISVTDLDADTEIIDIKGIGRQNLI